MARRPHIPNADQPEFSFGLELPSNETVNEGPATVAGTPPPNVAPSAPPAAARAEDKAPADAAVTEAPAEKPLNRKQRRAASRAKPTASAPAPAERTAPSTPVSADKPVSVRPKEKAPAAVRPSVETFTSAAPDPKPSSDSTASAVPAVAADPAVPAAVAPAVPAARPVPAAEPPAAAPKAVSKPATRIRPADAKQPTPFETLLHNELGRVFNFCLRLTQDAALADDLTQDVFVAAAKDLPEATSEAPAPHRLTRDAIDLFRRDRRYGRPRRAIVETPDNPGASSQRTEPVFNLPAVWDALPPDHRALLAAMGTLGADDRVILVLKDVEGRSYADAGDILEASESWVRARVSLARERLHAAVRKLSEQKKP